MEQDRAKQEEWRQEFLQDTLSRKMAEAKDSRVAHTGEALGKVIKSGTSTEALRQGVKLGLEFRREIDEGRFDGAAFIIVLILSVVKDFLDFASLGVIGAVINIFVTTFLVIIFFLRFSTLKKWFIKKFLWKYVLAIIIEFIPGFNIFPSYTISCLLMKQSADKKAREMEASLEEYNKSLGISNVKGAEKYLQEAE